MQAYILLYLKLELDLQLMIVFETLLDFLAPPLDPLQQRFDLLFLVNRGFILLEGTLGLTPHRVERLIHMAGEVRHRGRVAFLETYLLVGVLKFDVGTGAEVVHGLIFF